LAAYRNRWGFGQDAALSFGVFSILVKQVRLWVMESAVDWHGARALLEWQIELGVTETILDQPVDRYALPSKLMTVDAAKSVAATGTGPAGGPVTRASAGPDPVAVAVAAAGVAQTLPALREALAGYDHCSLKQGARNLVFSDGNPKARVMVIGEAPGRDEDRVGRPFAGHEGQFLDKMLLTIGLDRTATEVARGVYMVTVLPWRPPQNRDLRAEDMAMMEPFFAPHVALAAPDVIVLMGNLSCQAALGTRGIARLRGTWTTAWGRPALPMLLPGMVLRTPEAKRDAWADLLALRAHLEE
jgi:uracil-DNA glycosylase family 4